MVVLVLRPHQKPGAAFAFESRDKVVGGWRDGYFKWYSADNSTQYASEKPENEPLTFEDAIDDIRHDLNGCDVLECKEDLEYLLASRKQLHNFPFADVMACAEKAGWIESDGE